MFGLLGRWPLCNCSALPLLWAGAQTLMGHSAFKLHSPNLGGLLVTLGSTLSSPYVGYYFRVSEGHP